MPTDGRNKHIRRGAAKTNRWDDDHYTRRARKEQYPGPVRLQAPGDCRSATASSGKGIMSWTSAARRARG